MKKANIQKWINALRSEEYKQSKGKLQDKHGYCLLGVACEVFIPKSNQRQTNGILDETQPHRPNWLGCINHDFFSKTGGDLLHLNDTDNFSFDEIADLLQAVYIEEVLENV